MDKPSGGPAFPIESCERANFFGMSLRDYFAAAAMTGFFANGNVRHGKLDNTWCPEYCAKQAYLLADAMLQERIRQ